MITRFSLLAVAAAMLACGREVKGPPHAGAKPVTLPGDATQEQWSGPSSGKSERNVPDPVTGTPNQVPASQSPDTRQP